MAGFLDGIGGLLGWFSPERRDRAKRAKLEALKSERAALMRGPCTARMAARVQQIDVEIAKIERDLRS